MTVMDLGEMVRLYGPWAGLLAMIVYSLRGQIWGLIDRRARLGEVDREQDLRFDDKARGVLLDSMQRNWQYLDRITQQYEDERRERRLLGDRLIEQATSTERIVNEAMRTMQGFAEVGRMQCDRLDEQLQCQRAMTERSTAAIEALTRTMTAIWFILARNGLKVPEDINALEVQLREDQSD